jgi:hypothetical protein
MPVRLVIPLPCQIRFIAKAFWKEMEKLTAAASRARSGLLPKKFSGTVLGDGEIAGAHGPVLFGFTNSRGSFMEELPTPQCLLANGHSG